MVSFEISQISISSNSGNNKINVKQILSENQNLKIALKTAEKQKNDKNDNCEANNETEMKSGKNSEKRNESLILSDFHSIELELYIQIKNIIHYLTLSNLLQLPHIMDLLTILGETNIKLGSDFLIRLQNIFEFKPKLMERTDVSTNLNEKLDDDNPVFGTQLSKIIIEIDLISKQVYEELNNIFHILADTSNLQNIEIENNIEKNMPKNKLKSVDLSFSKKLKSPAEEEKMRIEKKISDLQNKNENKNKNSNIGMEKKIKLNLLSENLINKLLDLGFYMTDVICSLSILFQSAVESEIQIYNFHENKKNKENKCKNLLSLSSIFFNFDILSSGFYLSEKCGKVIISTLQFLYEEVRHYMKIDFFILSRIFEYVNFAFCFLNFAYVFCFFTFFFFY